MWGLVAGACFGEFGVTVTLMDANPNRVQQLHPEELPLCHYSVLQEMGFGDMSVGRTPIDQMASEESAENFKGNLQGFLPNV